MAKTSAKKAAAVAAATKKKGTKPTEPDGTKVLFVMADGTKISNAVWQSGRVCCPTCKRKLPKGPDTAARVAKRKERAENLKMRAQEEFRHVANLIKKNAVRLGEPEPSDADILKMLAAAGNG